MRLEKAWTLIWERTGELVPGLDDGAEGMLILSEESAIAEAERQSDMYADEDGTLGRIVAVPLEVY